MNAKANLTPERAVKEEPRSGQFLDGESDGVVQARGVHDTADAQDHTCDPTSKAGGLQESGRTHDLTPSRRNERKRPPRLKCGDGRLSEAHEKPDAI